MAARFMDRLYTADRELMERAPSSSARLDKALITLTRAANHSVLWIAIAGALTTRKGPARRGGLRGLFAIAVSSGIANALLKPVFPRPRPPLHAVPVNRNLITVPRSSSFPSGHSASAFAFATAVGLESPALGAVLMPVAATVAYSRVHVGAHWPSDIVAGSLLGIAVARATRRWWPVAGVGVVELNDVTPGPQCPDGAGLLVLVNPNSGKDGDSPFDASMAPSAHVVVAHGDLSSQLDDAIATHQPRALGVVGGDGSVSLTANVAVERELPLAVFGGGTLNHFARDTCDDPAATMRAITQGSVRATDVATAAVDFGKPAVFVNTASIGGYPELVRVREKLEHRVGKWPAAALAAGRVLRRATPIDIRIDGERIPVWMIFIGNGSYLPAGGLPLARRSLRDGQLDVRYLRADVRFARLRAVVAMATGSLNGSLAYVRRLMPNVTVESADELSLATDGEFSANGRRFDFVALRGGLQQYAQSRD